MDAAASRFLAFDLGAESGRAVLGTLAGDRLTLEERHRFANQPGRMAGHLYWNLLAQWEELKAGLRKGAAGGVTLDGVGVDTWGVDFGLIGPTGDILANPFHYRDTRTDGMMDRAFARVPREELFEITGIQFLPFNSLFQLLALRHLHPHLLGAAETMLFMPDLFNYLFTGRRVTESSIASTSQMIDPRTGQWAIDLLARLDLPARILPPIVPSGTVVGRLADEVARDCGLASVPVIAPACHDTASAVAAVPADEGESWCYVSSGTWSLVGVELDHPVINPKSLRYNYTNEGGVGGTIRLLKNIMGLWLVQECRRQWDRDGEPHDYAALTRMAQEARPLAALVDPNHAAFLSPGDMPRRIEAFCRDTRQDPPRTKGEFVRTCLESLALAYRATVEGLQDVLGRRIDTIHVVGGGSQNALLNQMTADACGRTVVAGPVEATAAGNVLLQAMATDRIASLSQGRQIVRHSFPVARFAPQDPTPWDRAYGRFRNLARQ